MTCPVCLDAVTALQFLDRAAIDACAKTRSPSVTMCMAMCFKCAPRFAKAAPALAVFFIDQSSYTDARVRLMPSVYE